MRCCSVIFASLPQVLKILSSDAFCQHCCWPARNGFSERLPPSPLLRDCLNATPVYLIFSRANCARVVQCAFYKGLLREVRDLNKTIDIALPRVLNVVDPGHLLQYLWRQPCGQNRSASSESPCSATCAPRTTSDPIIFLNLNILYTYIKQNIFWVYWICGSHALLCAFTLLSPAIIPLLHVVCLHTHNTFVHTFSLPHYDR